MGTYITDIVKYTEHAEMEAIWTEVYQILVYTDTSALDEAYRHRALKARLTIDPTEENTFFKSPNSNAIYLRGRNHRRQVV
jgi:hypothetical protein